MFFSQPYPDLIYKDKIANLI